MKKISLRKAIQLFGGTNIKLKANYYYCSGFFEKNNQLYYIMTSDIRTKSYNNTYFVCYRTAKSTNDYIGGTNCFDFIPTLKNMGYEINSVPYKA